MSVARTARRRRIQYAGGKNKLAQVFGKKAAPDYKKRSTSASRLAKWMENKRKGLF